jgi:hypothetical protein
LDAALNRIGFRLKEILTNSLTTDEPVQTTALVKEIEPVVKKNMSGMLLFAVAASFFLRRRWFGPPVGSASSSLGGLGAHQSQFSRIDSHWLKLALVKTGKYRIIRTIKNVFIYLTP